MEIIKILHIEDEANDAKRINAEVRKSTFQIELLSIKSRVDLKEVLEKYSPDIILLNDNIANSGSLETLKVIKQAAHAIPLILITGVISDNMAMKLLQEGGISDYLHKDHLERLPAAIFSGLEKGRLEKERRLYLERLIERERLLRVSERLSRVGSWYVNMQTGQVEWSDESFRMFGYEPDTVAPSLELFLSHIHPEDLERVKHSVSELIKHNDNLSLDFRLVTTNGEMKYIRGKIFVEYDRDKNVVILQGYNQDISELKNKEEQLYVSEVNLSAIFENTNDSIYSIDRDFRFVKFNSVLKKHLKENYHINIKPGDHAFDFLEKISSQEADEWKRVYKKAFQGKALHFAKEMKVNNSCVFFSIYPIKKDDEIIGLSCYARDITRERKNRARLVKSERKIRNFAHDLNKRIEEERTTLAREMHDELGQQLAGIKMCISSLSKANHWENQEKRQELITELFEDLDNAIQSVRKIATRLRPGILDKLGLGASIEWLVKEFEKKTKIAPDIHIDADLHKYNPDISICFFRICQEALTNILKYSNASKVSVYLQHENDLLKLKVADNGVGITRDKLENPFSMGLLGMRERANVIGGNLQIMSQVNNGTTVQLTAKANYGTRINN